MRKALLGFAICAVVALAAPPSFGDEPAPPPPPWTGSVGFGLGATSGNTSTSSFNLTFGAKYDPGTQNLFKMDGFCLWGQTEHVTTTNKGALVLRYERKLSERTFCFGQLGYLKDQFAGFTCLITPTVGVGVHAVKNDAVDLQFLAGAGGAFEKDVGLPSTSSAALSAGQSFDWKISKTATLSQHLSGIWKTDDWSDAYYHFDVSLGTSITRRS